jgi:hypothetical protein
VADILFAVESDESRSLPLTAQRLVNFFTEKQRQGSKSQTPLFGAPGLSAFANTSTIIGAIAAFGLITGGAGYATGTYTNVPLTGGSGSGAVGTVTISGGAVSSVVITVAGINYQINDVLSASNANLGGAGSGFSVPVTGLTARGIAAFGAFTPGSGYVSARGGLPYVNVPLLGGSGTGATANITVAEGVLGQVTSVVISIPGQNYLVGDILTVSNAYLGGTGSGFSVPVATLTGGGVGTLGSITGGSGYASTLATYYNVPLTGGSGTGALATITINASAVVGVAIESPGINYLVGDVLSAAASTIGGSGSGFSVPVAAINTIGPVRGSWVRQDVPYVVAGNSLYQLSLATTGVFTGVPLTGGFGKGAIANITITGGAVSAIALTADGVGFFVGDVLSAPLGGGTAFSVSVATLSNAIIAALGAITGGVGYTNGTYYNVPLTGGSGAGAQATITVSGGVVTAVMISVAGIGYIVGDVLSALNTNIGGTGSGFSVPVATLTGGIATLGPIAGGSNYQVGIASLVGSGIGGSDIVSMSDNGFQLCMVSGQARAGWVLDTNPQSATFGFQQITDPAFYPANTVSFFDGYFIFDRIGTNEFFLSNLYDGTTYNALDFASAESQPDFVTGTVQNLQLLFIICQEHLELWYDAGSFPFPFQRYTGAGISYGCVSPHTIIKQDGAIFFLGADKIFYRLQSTVPIRVSSHSVEHVIAQDGDITQAYCFTFTLEGHKMVALTLPISKRTVIFDISTGRWHDRESWDQNNVSLGQWRASTAFRAFNNTYMGDGFNGNVNLLDWTTYTEVGNTIRGLAYSIPYHQDRKRLTFFRFELDIQAGVGLPSGYGSNPQIMLGWSVDGAQTFKPLQFWRSMGMIGQYLTRLRWLRMGQARQWVFVISCTDPVPRVIIGASADISVGM